MSVGFILVRLIRVVITVWAAATLVFIMLRFAGDPVSAMVPPDMPQEIIDLYRAKLGLDQPIYVQYFHYMTGLIQGDFGFSFRTKASALQLVLDRLPATLLLTGAALILAIFIGVPAGIYAAIRRNTLADRAIMSASVFGFAMPNFFFGILLILLFSQTLRWLPSSGAGSPLHIIMPALTLGLASAGAYARLTRSSLLEVLNAPFMRTARAKGLDPRRKLVVHGLRAILVPLTSLFGFSIGALIAGAIVTETVFAWPGIGRLLVVSVTERDLAVVQVVVIFSATFMAVANGLVDIFLGTLDPRIGSARRIAQ